MRKSSTRISALAAIALALTSGTAFAQSGPGGMIPAGPNAPADGANKNQGAAGMGHSDYDANAQRQYGTQPMPEQYRSQAEGAQRTFSTGNTDNPHTVAITDEYGNKYNSRGERIGQGRPNR